MFLIWGSRWRKKHLQVLNYDCVVCHEKMLNVYSMQRWFTFFFIPIFPTSTSKFYLECPNCENSHRLKEEIDLDAFLEQHGIHQSENGVREQEPE